MKRELIRLLNKALQNEYVETFSYSKEADIIKQKEIQDKFEQFARMELRHADSLGMQIVSLGGKPNWNFIPLDVVHSINRLLRIHLKRERKSINLYTRLIEYAKKEDETQLILILRGIRAEEKLHFKEIKKILNKRIKNAKK